MFLKVQLSWNVILPAKSLGLAVQGSIVQCLLDDFTKRRATKDLGHLVAVQSLEKIGAGKVREEAGDVLFPVVFSCITFRMLRGEILEGKVHKVYKLGVMLRCGPVENIFLSHHKIKDYHYVPGENPTFMSDNLSVIGKDVAVRFVVIGTQWLEVERDFMALASLEGDALGPV